MSGSLFLSPPLPRDRGRALIDRLSSAAGRLDKNVSLREASVETLLEALKACEVTSMWLQMTDELEGWQDSAERVEALMLGDVEYESSILRNGVEGRTVSEIETAFSMVEHPGDAERLRRMYGIDAHRSTASKLGALDFINDVRFAIPCHEIANRRRQAGQLVYQYLIDQTNPWQASAHSHHGLDLVLLFGGYNLSFQPHAEDLGGAMKHKWISFVNGNIPWDAKAVMAFGPVGRSEQLADTSEFA